MDVNEILKKHAGRIEKQVKTFEMPQDFSREYSHFKQDMMPQLSRYEKTCRALGNIVKIKPAKKDADRIQASLDRAHLDLTPSETTSFSVISFLLVFFLGVMISVALYLLQDSFPILFLFLIIIASLFIFYYTYTMPSRLANRWRLKAGSQMVPCILYAVIYMKHTSNLERAIAFAAQNLKPPLALDFKKIFWDIETGKFSTIKESLDSYLEVWRKDSIEFLESFHLIESSLYEPSDARRIQILERALQVMLDGIYDKMLKYSHNVKAPLTNIYMLGIVLPTLALALLPLASTLMGGLITWQHVFVLFNIIIPFFVFYLTSQVMSKRPGGYGESELLEENPLYPKYKSKKPWLTAFLICFPLFLLGILPFLFQYTGLPELIGLQKDYDFSALGLTFLKGKIFHFEDGAGPFGAMALLLSLFIPLSIALFFSIAYRKKTKGLIKTRKETKQLEKEFTSSLFLLGNRLADGIPAEIAFAKVAESSRGIKTESFFRMVNSNIQQAGMSVEQAVFNPKRGALIYYPSSLINTSMRILVEGTKKGLKVAARSLMSISDYIRNIQKIEDRLRDLLAEVVSDMKSNMTFLAPLLAGIVIGLASMIASILVKLRVMFDLGEASEVAGMGIPTLTSLFDYTKMIPPYFLQIAIGMYLIEIIFILTTTLVVVDSGEDKLKKKYDISKNLSRGISLYILVGLIAIIALSILAGVAVGGLSG